MKALLKAMVWPVETVVKLTVMRRFNARQRVMEIRDRA
jgi:hypothetical protein